VRLSEWREAFSVAIDCLRTHRTRTALTGGSVAIGVAGIGFCLAAGQNLAGFVESEVRSLGTDLMWIEASRDEPGGTSTKPLTAEDVPAIAAVAGVRNVGPRVVIEGTATFRRRRTSVRVIGTTPGYFTMRNKEIALGRPLVDDDVAYRRRVCVLGPEVAERLLFESADPIGQLVRLDKEPMLVVGVLRRRNGPRAPGLEEDAAAFVPLTTAESLFGARTLDLLFFQPSRELSRALVTQHVRQVLLSRKGARSVYEVESLDDRIAQMDGLIWFVVSTIVAIAGVALLVAGMGIMNIMLLSVTERTREIGIRRSVGARREHIVIQFFAEALLLSGTGAIVGVALSVAALALVGAWTGAGIRPPLGPLAVAVLVGIGVGVAFGLYPARQASRLDPTVALAREAT
jgi:putative ABC transport system permease protein